MNQGNQMWNQMQNQMQNQEENQMYSFYQNDMMGGNNSSRDIGLK